MHSSSNDLPLRDQIALDIYTRGTYLGKVPFKNFASIAYKAADIFLAEMAKQAPRPEAPEPEAPMPTPTEERKTVPPEVGKRFYMRCGLSTVCDAKHLADYYFADGRHVSNPLCDLVDECPT